MPLIVVNLSEIFLGGMLRVISEKPKQGSWGYAFLKKTPGIFRFVILPLDILEKTSFHPWKFCKVL